MNKLRRPKKGFTLIELIIVIAILAILAALLIPNMMAYIEEAKEVSDLQLASNIVRAATYSIANQSNDIPTGYYIEILWVTGEESIGYAAYGDVIVRYGVGTSRYSIFNSGDASDNVPALTSSVASIEKFATELLTILGAEEITASASGQSYSAHIEDAKSILANKANFAFHINSGTGEVALAKLHSSSNPDNLNRWIELGISATPAI